MASVPLPVILSADHARAGHQRLPRRNLGRGRPPLSLGGSPQNAKMPNKLVEDVAATFRSPGVVRWRPEGLRYNGKVECMAFETIEAAGFNRRSGNNQR